MDDPAAVRLGDRLAGLEHERHRVRDIHRSAPLELRGEVSAVEVLHDHVRRAGLEGADVRHARDVLALDLHGGLRFAEEARRALGLLRDLEEQELQGDALLELHVGRRDDDAHAAFPDDALDPVLAGEDLTFVHRGSHDREPS